MVRVISVHHFTHQDVSGLDRVGHGVAQGKGDYLFIGGEHKVDIRDLQNEGNHKGSFPTVDSMQQLVYCQKGNYVCTLESKPARHGGDHTYVRIYMNWENENDTQPMRARIAGRVTPSGHSGLESLEMVEIPTKKPVDCIACCQTSGNVALACGMSISIFKYCLKVHEVSKIRFVDFEEIIEIDMAFVIKEIAIAEDLIGCLSDTEAHIFQVQLNYALLKNASEETQDSPSPESVMRPKSRSKSKTRSASRSPGRASQCSMSQFKGQKVLQRESSMQLIRNADDYVDLSDIKWVPTICYGKKHPANSDSKFLLFPSLVGSAQCGSVSDPGEILGPISSAQCSNVRVKLVSGHGSSQRVSTGIFDAITLLHRKIDQVSEPDLPFSNLRILSLYDDNLESKDRSPSPGAANNPLIPSSSDRLKRVGATVFLTSPHIGYLYHVSLRQEIKDCSVVRGGVFSYTAPVDTVALESCLLHALTLTGLETYTLRPHPYIIESYLCGEQDMIVPAHWEESVCLVGLRPFLNVESLTLTDSCLALIAANEEGGDKSHTLYSLHLPSAASLYKEMIRVGLSHCNASPPTYLHLLLEAHLVLITALKNEKPDNSKLDDLHSLIQESSALLGDYYSGCHSEVEWNQAVQYYKSSSLSPDAIIERLPLDSPGLVHILSSLLLDASASPLSPAQANSILDTLENVAPKKVSLLVLKSACLKECKKDKVLNIIKQELSKTSDPYPTDVLALALIILQRGSPEQVSSVLTILRSHQLCEILLAHSKVLLDFQDGHLKLSPFAQVLMEYKRDVCMEVFVLMIGEGTLSLDAFVDAYMAVYPIVSCGIECNVNSLRLRDFLENFFAEFGNLSELTPQKEKYKKSITVLVGLYLASLIGAFNFETDEERSQTELRASRINLFEDRPSYLNHVPPFNGKTPTAFCKLNATPEESNDSLSPEKEPTQSEGGEGVPPSSPSKEEEECNCRQCCLHLLVLQSLMASDLPSIDDRTTVLKFATCHPEIKGSASLRLLCLDPPDQRTFLLQKFPKAIIHYCKDVYESPWEWESIVSQLINCKNGLEPEDSKYEAIQDALNEVFAELVMTAPFGAFIEIVPKEHQEQYKAQIRQCHSAGIAHYLKSTFTTYADNVLQQMAK